MELLHTDTSNVCLKFLAFFKSLELFLVLMDSEPRQKSLEDSTSLYHGSSDSSTKFPFFILILTLISIKKSTSLKSVLRPLGTYVRFIDEIK